MTARRTHASGSTIITTKSGKMIQLCHVCRRNQASKGSVWCKSCLRDALR